MEVTSVDFFGTSGERTLNYMCIPEEIPGFFNQNDWARSSLTLIRLSDIRIDTHQYGRRVINAIRQTDDGVRVELVYNWDSNGCIWALDISNSIFLSQSTKSSTGEPEKINITHRNAVISLVATSQQPTCVIQSNFSSSTTYLAFRYSTFLASGLMNRRPVLHVPYRLSLFNEDVLAFDERSGTMLLRDRTRFLLIQY
jgi:hypothetical protein